MKKKISAILTILILCGVCSVRADTVWTEGHHEINDGDVYGEIWMYNDCTLDIFGGDIYRLAAYDTTITDWYDGTMDTLWALEDCIVNIYGGELEGLYADDNSSVNIYAYNTVYHSQGGYLDLGWLEGYYINSNLYFIINVSSDSFSHVNIIPEPSTLSLLAFGGLLLKRKR